MLNDLSDSDLQQFLVAIANEDDQAISQFWDAHFDRLAALARQKMSRSVSRIADGEDIALSVLNSFFTGVTQQRFRNLDSKNKIWNLLSSMVLFRVAKRYRHEKAQKRGGGQVRGESVFVNDADRNPGLANVAHSVSRSSSPLLDVEFLDTCERFFDALPDEKTRNVARLMLEGYTMDDVAEELGCVRRTVERKLQQIREIWSRLSAD